MDFELRYRRVCGPGERRGKEEQVEEEVAQQEGRIIGRHPENILQVYLHIKNRDISNSKTDNMKGPTKRREMPPPTPKAFTAPNRTHQTIAYEHSSIAVLSFSRLS